MTFIPAPRKVYYIQSKAYCLISLLSFMQKTMQKLVNRNINDETLGHRTIRHTMISSLGILEKNNDECILILVIYWKKTGLVHTKLAIII